MNENPAWLLFLHQLPARPTRLRVRVWRQLQRLGAVAVKNSVYVLPFSERTLEDFTWLKQEIESGGGEATLFRASSVAEVTDEEMIATFRRDRDTAYERLTSDLQSLCERLAKSRVEEPAAPGNLEVLNVEVDRMQTRLEEIDAIDFFKAKGRAGAAAGLSRARGSLRAAQGRKSGAPRRAGSRPAMDRADYQGRLWITRPRPHVDRCASAWLIRRFIDDRPRFGFAAEGGKLRRGIPYDMAGAMFGHQGEDCTFETLMRQFGLVADPAVRSIAEIVHDIDLKDSKFGRSEAAGVNAVLRGLVERVRDDRRLLQEAEALFDGLYATLGRRPSGGRKGAARKTR
jgi:hypothetical protein